LIPWSRVIPVASPPTAKNGQLEENVDLMREQVWRDLAREAVATKRGSSGGVSNDDAIANNGAGSSDAVAAGANHSPPPETSSSSSSSLLFSPP
jgi:hypothetical protein